MSRKKLIGKSTKLSDAGADDEITRADISQNVDGAMRNISLDLIGGNPHQPRRHFDSEKMAELTRSVKESGVLQPIIVRFEEQDVYLVAGERRLRAARAVGLKKIPAIITEGDPVHIALIENIQRENLNPLEEAQAMKKLMDERGYTQEQLAGIVGKAKSTVSEILSLNRLPETISEEVRRVEYYPKRMLVQIVKQKTPDKMIELFNKIKEQNLSSDAVMDIVRKDKRKAAKSGTQTSSAIISRKALDLASHIYRLNPSALIPRDRNILLNTLETLKKIIDDYIHEVRRSG